MLINLKSDRFHHCSGVCTHSGNFVSEKAKTMPPNPPKRAAQRRH